MPHNVFALSIVCMHTTHHSIVFFCNGNSDIPTVCSLLGGA